MTSCFKRIIFVFFSAHDVHLCKNISNSGKTWWLWMIYHRLTLSSVSELWQLWDLNLLLNLWEAIVQEFWQPINCLLYLVFWVHSCSCLSVMVCHVFHLQFTKHIWELNYWLDWKHCHGLCKQRPKHKSIKKKTIAGLGNLGHILCCLCWWGGWAVVTQHISSPPSPHLVNPAMIHHGEDVSVQTNLQQSVRFCIMEGVVGVVLSCESHTSV